MLSHISGGYRGAIVKVIKTLATDRITKEEKAAKYTLLGELIEAVIFINMQAHVDAVLTRNIPDELKYKKDEDDKTWE